MRNRKVLINLPDDVLKTLDTYARKEFKGNRSMAIYKILKTFFEPKEEEHAVS
jgi:metal-responsive CopG/Arc/MetJ family transcriptional regulator